MDLITPDALPAGPLDALRELVRCEDEIERLRRERITEGRAPPSRRRRRSPDGQRERTSDR